MYALEISTSEHNGVAIISLAGEINADTAPILESEILPQARRYNRLILDLAGVNAVSSIGLRKILMVYRAVKVHNGQVLLIGMNDALQGVMWAAGFLNYFITAESLEMALAAFD
jgi:anti-sigma B factor antagonist